MGGLIGTLSLKDLSLSGTLLNPEDLSGSMNTATNAAGVISSSFYRGKSAYEIAVENGFEGTEAQWLEQLIGNGIASAELNNDYTLTLTFTDGTSYTTPPIRGERGERGERGLQGIQGIQGLKGDTGNGIQSAQLNQDYTLTITFTNGTSYTTASIRGEKGEKGDQGNQGAKGDTGPRGYSAYEVSVQHGFVGTEEEWLETLGSKQATSVVPGIMKLYDETGQNVDGTMTQRSITNAIVDNSAQSISTDDLLEILI